MSGTVGFGGFLMNSCVTGGIQGEVWGALVQDTVVGSTAFGMR